MLSPNILWVRHCSYNKHVYTRDSIDKNTWLASENEKELDKNKILTSFAFGIISCFSPSSKLWSLAYELLKLLHKNNSIISVVQKLEFPHNDKA